MILCIGDAEMVGVVRVQSWSNTKLWVLLERMTRMVEVESKAHGGGGMVDGGEAGDEGG